MLFIVGYNTGGFLFYNLSLLELQPKYLCTNTTNPGVEYPCKAADFCGKENVQHRIDWDDKTSLHNWVETLDLTCAQGTKVGLIGSMYFFGLAGSAIVLPRLSDLFGRKRIYFISMAAHLAVYLVFLLSTSLTLNIVMMFFFGSLSVVRASIGYIYMQEFTPVAQQSIVGTLVQVITGTISILACIYFYFISPWWRPFQIFAWALNLVIVGCVFLVPESPKYLLSKKRFAEARVSLRYIAKVNKRDPAVVERMVFEGETASAVSAENEEASKLTGGLSDLIKIKRHLINLVIMAVVWIASAFNYFLINFKMKSFPGNIYVNTSIASGSEIVAYILAGIAY